MTDPSRRTAPAPVGPAPEPVRTALFVGGDPEAADPIVRQLAAAGIEVIATSRRSSDALAALERVRPDLLVTSGSLATRVLRRIEDQFFTNAIDLLCHLGFDGVFRRLNPAWERTLGFTIEELTSRPFIEFVHPDDRERTLARNQEVRGGDPALGFENRYLCKDGSFRWLRWNATPHIEAGVIHSVARDITEERAAAEERERLVKELQEALSQVRALGELLPICSYCRKIRDDGDYWHSVESYMALHTTTRFTHSICPGCMVAEVEPSFGDFPEDPPGDPESP